ncbi:MAG: AI-2E family transporter, partial [Verrucomicrobiota bacterium]
MSETYVRFFGAQIRNTNSGSPDLQGGWQSPVFPGDRLPTTAMSSETVEIKVEGTAPIEAKVEVSPPPALTDLTDFLNRTRATVPLAILGIFLIGIIYLIHFARPFLMPVVLALLLNFLLKPVVRLLARIKIRETFGAIIVMLVFFGILGLAVSQLTQPATDWVTKAPETTRKLETKIRRLLRPAAKLTQAAATVENITQSEDTNKAPQVEVRKPHLTDNLLSYTTSFLAGALETIVLLYFLLASGDLFMQKMVKVLPTLHDKKKAVEIGNELQQNISTFL